MTATVIIVVLVILHNLEILLVLNFFWHNIIKNTICR